MPGFLKYLEENDVDEATLISYAPKKFLDDTGLSEALICTSTLPKPERKAATAIPRRPGVKS